MFFFNFSIKITKFHFIRTTEIPLIFFPNNSVYEWPSLFLKRINQNLVIGIVLRGFLQQSKNEYLQDFAYFFFRPTVILETEKNYYRSNLHSIYVLLKILQCRNGNKKQKSQWWTEEQRRTFYELYKEDNVKDWTKNQMKSKNRALLIM